MRPKRGSSVRKLWGAFAGDVVHRVDDRNSTPRLPQRGDGLLVEGIAQPRVEQRREDELLMAGARV